MKDTKEKLSIITISLHWLISALIIGNLTVALLASKRSAPFITHKSIGILILLLILLYILRRLISGWTPSLVDNPVQRKLARLMHWLLVICILLMPVSGILMTVLEGRPLLFFGIELLGRNVIYNDFIAHIAHTTHHFVSNTLIVLIVLHTLAALKHHFINKDNVLKRMFGKKV